MANVVDYAFSHPNVAALKQAGTIAACRYLAPLPNSKCLTLAEANELRAAGIDVVSNWEYYGDWTHDYSGGHARGTSHAAEAARQHTACGGPADRPIYFSTDFNPTLAQLPTIADYYRGVASVIGLARTGAYGGYATIKYLFDQGVITWGWQAYAWSDGQWDPRAQLRQTRNGVTIGGADCDLDQSMTIDFGQWGATMATSDDRLLNGWPVTADSDGNPDTRGVGVHAADNWRYIMDGHGAYGKGRRDATKDPSNGAYLDDLLCAIRDQAHANGQALIQLAASLAMVTTPTDEQLAVQADRIAAALVASHANGLTATDHAAVVADVKQALREGAG